MKISYTELSDILHKLFEGMGFPLGDYEDCARTVSWLAFHGRPILQQLTTIDPLTPTKPVQILAEAGPTAVLEAKHNDGLLYSSLALDLAYLKSKASGGQMATVVLKNGRLPQLLLPNLIPLAARGYAAQLGWHEGHTGYIATIQPHTAYPSLTQESAAGKTDGDVVVRCGTAVFPSRGTVVHSPQTFAHTFETHLSHGLTVDDAIWQQLQKRAKNVLVAATEASRRKGAGEAV